MRYFVFSDIHGNQEALGELIEFSKTQKIDHYVCLGDLVGYGASPNEIIDTVRLLKPISIIRGNHDKAVYDNQALKSFNPMAASAIYWTRQNIHDDSLKFLINLPKGPRNVGNRLFICHGAPFDEDFYIFGEFDAAEAFLHTKYQINFFGHTHFPVVYTENDHLVSGNFINGNEVTVALKADIRYLINPGSVGQPRDRNPRASCAVFDSKAGKVYFHRLEYDIAAAQQKIVEARLPNALAERLTVGI